MKSIELGIDHEIQGRYFYNRFDLETLLGVNHGDISFFMESGVLRQSGWHKQKGNPVFLPKAVHELVDFLAEVD